MRSRLALAIRICLFVALPLVVSRDVSASALTGKVTEVIDGATVSIVSLNHPLKVRISGVAPPESNQPFSDSARQHLSDLILGKYVVIRYSRLEHDSFLRGKILLEGMDIGAQMIRDGVAWYNKDDASDLAENDRQVYVASEKAAHDERRGLWQDESPTPPWDFRRAQLSALKASQVTFSQLSARPKRATTGLASEDMMGSFLRPGSLAGKPNVRPISPNGSSTAWIRFEPADHRFSVQVPADGVEVSGPIWNSHGVTVDVHEVMGVRDGALYALAWMKMADDYSGDGEAAEGFMKTILADLDRLKQYNPNLDVRAIPVRDVSLNGYSGKQFRIAGNWLPGVFRILSKKVGDSRELFMLVELNSGEALNNQFLNSLRIRGN